ncbi:hypothetical protein OPT61_g5033 [Boeremia exigua]|uniref:Uncharacterized protein n=1 Tax=Boeremia exigua TaxID=749465 RepID=A0ACC2IBW3_9PLEO|nr:hypothetical protein OPT61_g5033 [Boeremia exigua]
MVSKLMKSNNKWRRRIIRLLDDLLTDLQRRPPGLEQGLIIDRLTSLSNRADSMFEGLGQVERAESLYYTRPIEISNKESVIVYRLKDCAEDTAFATYCFLQDASYLRLFSARAWREFALSKIGIQTATFCTNSTDAQIGRMSEELRKTFDHFNDTWMTRMHPKVDTFFRSHCGDAIPTADPFLDEIHPDCEDVILARHANRRLGYYACTLICAKMSRMSFEAFLGSPREHLSDSLHDMCMVKSLYQLRCLQWPKDAISSALRADCMYSGAHALVLGHIDTDAIFTAQMLYDIQQQINPQTLGTENIIGHLCHDYHDLYRVYAPEWNNETFKAAHPSRTQRMCEQYKLLDKIVGGDDDIQLQDILERWECKTDRQYTIPGFQLLRHAPSLIGQLVAHFRTDFHTEFLDITNDSGYILTACHLYNAAKASGALQLYRWVDIEWVIDHQSRYTIFGGELPVTDTEYIRRFCLVYGLDSTKFLHSRKPTPSTRVKNDIRPKGSFPRRLESCSQLVRICTRTPRTCTDTPWAYPVAAKTMEDFADNQLDWLSTYGKPNKIGVLIASKESYDSDEEALNFDIFALHLKCARLLTKIRDICIEEAPEDYPMARFGGEQGINPTVAEVLRDLIAVPRYHARMWPTVVRLMSGMIQEEGSACLDMAFERMKVTTLDSVTVDSDVCSETGLLTPPLEEIDENAGYSLSSQDRQDAEANSLN